MPAPSVDLVPVLPRRPRRFSLLTLPSAAVARPRPRRSSTRTQSLSLPPTHSLVADNLPPIPFAEPPFMPMYQAPPSPRTPSRLVKAPPSPSSSRPPACGLEEDLWNEPPTTPRRAPLPSSSSTSSAKLPTRTPPSRDLNTSRLKRRLQRWTRSHDLDFGCAGDWSEGPADLGHAFYSSQPGGSSRTSMASSSDEAGAKRSHSRGQSTSSDWSVSTAASSISASPVLGCSIDLLPPAPLSPSPCRVPLTPRSAHRRRQSDEAAAVDAANQYFSRGRLSQIAEDDSSRKSRCSSTRRSRTPSTPPPPVPRGDSSSPAGLAIYTAGRKLQSSLEQRHSRSTSYDLEVEFIETGHTTYTPLSVHGDDFPLNAIILPNDAFLLPSTSPALVATPSTSSTFTAESADSCESATTTSTARFVRRSPIAAHDMGPALDELSEYFISSVPELSCSSSMTSASSASTSTYGDVAVKPLPHISLAPPSPISPQRKRAPRYNSTTTSPVVSPPPTPVIGGGRPAAARHRRQSSSFAAAEQARLAAAGLVCPLRQPQVLYDWI
ncbi:hypothetical protein JCM9279_004986 [Rhodotorula babjevae]